MPRAAVGEKMAALEAHGTRLETENAIYATDITGTLGGLRAVWDAITTARYSGHSPNMHTRLLVWVMGFRERGIVLLIFITPFPF